MNSGDRTSASGLKLVEASGLHVAAQSAVNPVPLPGEKSPCAIPGGPSVAAKAQNMALQARTELLQEPHHVNEGEHAAQQHLLKQAYDSGKSPFSPQQINTCT